MDILKLNHFCKKKVNCYINFNHSCLCAFWFWSPFKTNVKTWTPQKNHLSVNGFVFPQNGKRVSSYFNQIMERKLACLRFMEIIHVLFRNGIDFLESFVSLRDSYIFLYFYNCLNTLHWILQCPLCSVDQAIDCWMQNDLVYFWNYERFYEIFRHSHTRIIYASILFYIFFFWITLTHISSFEYTNGYKFCFFMENEMLHEMIVKTLPHHFQKLSYYIFGFKKMQTSWSQK